MWAAVGNTLPCVSLGTSPQPRTLQRLPAEPLYLRASSNMCGCHGKWVLCGGCRRADRHRDTSCTGGICCPVCSLSPFLSLQWSGGSRHESTVSFLGRDWKEAGLVLCAEKPNPRASPVLLSSGEWRWRSLAPLPNCLAEPCEATVCASEDVTYRTPAQVHTVVYTQACKRAQTPMSAF